MLGFRKTRSSPTATLVITQGGEPDEIQIDLTFWPNERQEEDPMAFKAMMVGYAAIMGSIEGEITSLP